MSGFQFYAVTFNWDFLDIQKLETSFSFVSNALIVDFTFIKIYKRLKGSTQTRAEFEVSTYIHLKNNGTL